MRQLSKGAESYIYYGKFLGLSCVLKRRSGKKYRLREMDHAIRAGRTKKEAKLLTIVSAIGINAPKLLFLDKYDIYMTKIPGTRLNYLINENKNFSNVFSAIGKILAILHENNITHGDFTPANIIIDGNNDVHIIDFGLSEITTSIEDKAIDILLLKRSIDRESYGEFLKSYRRSGGSDLILKRLEEIEKRGRYNTRTLLA